MKKLNGKLIRTRIDFLKRVCAIEDYSYKEMDISGNISEADYCCVFKRS